VAWEEQDGNVSGSGNHDQIFVSKGVKQAAPNSPCTGFKPSDAASVSTFCWQQVGLDRLDENGDSSSTGDPTLNIDPSRNGVEPDIAFTGASDKVSWVVWYEKDSSALGLNNNEQVFAAKIVADANADGGFDWQALGNGTAGQTNTLDTSGNGFGACAASTTAENACSLNAVPTNDAEDPRVASGTLVAGNPTVPWVAWSEDTGSGNHSIFVSRLVGDHFELFNGGAPVSPAHRDAESPDITFFGNVPYVSWIEPHGDENRGFIGHFLQTGQFVSDTPFGILLAPHIKRAPLIDARVALSSSCTSDPFTNDGAACPVAAVNAPFATFTTAGQPQRLFSQAVIGGPNGALFPGCKLAVVPTDDGADIDSTLNSGQTVGILVQRIVGSKRVHGVKVPVLRPVGRVPLGHHHSGHVKIHWDLKVNGHRLRKGKYQIVLRSIGRHLTVLGTTNPVTLTIRH
jgi:hypothetical protein